MPRTSLPSAWKMVKKQLQQRIMMIIHIPNRNILSQNDITSRLSGRTAVPSSRRFQTRDFTPRPMTINCTMYHTAGEATLWSFVKCHDLWRRDAAPQTSLLGDRQRQEINKTKATTKKRYLCAPLFLKCTLRAWNRNLQNEYLLLSRRNQMKVVPKRRDSELLDRNPGKVRAAK